MHLQLPYLIHFQKFAERIKLSRSKSVDHLRQLMAEIDEKYPYKTFSELKTILFGCPEAQYLVSEREINNIMDDIERELEFQDIQRRVIEQDRIFQLETEDLLRFVEEYKAKQASSILRCCICNNESADQLCDSCCDDFEKPFM